MIIYLQILAVAVMISGVVSSEVVKHEFTTERLEEDETSKMFDMMATKVVDPARRQDCYTQCDILAFGCHIGCLFQGWECHRTCGLRCKQYLCELVVAGF